MARENHRKIKILKLMEILRQLTDEQHPMTTNRLVVKLGDMGIPCDRRTLSQDIAALTAAGHEIMSTIGEMRILSPSNLIEQFVS